MEPESKKYQVYGELIIHFYYPVEGISKEDAYDKAAKILNQQNIELVDADIHTSNGNILPLLSDNCRVKLQEVLDEEDI